MKNVSHVTKQKAAGVVDTVATKSPYHRTPGYSAIIFTTTTALIAIDATAIGEGDPENVEGRKTTSVTGEAVGGGRGLSGQRREVMGGVKPATVRLVWWVQKAVEGSVRVSRSGCAPSTTPPLPPHCFLRNRCPCSEFCVRWELSTPGEVSFPAKAALSVGRHPGALW